MCYFAKGNARQAIIGATNIGRDTDTIAAIAGELMGVLFGAQALPAEWVEKVLRLNPNPDLPQMARDLSILISHRAQASNRAAGEVLTLTNP